MAVPRFVFFSLQNKKADPLLSFSAGGALVEPSSSPSETPGRRTTPPRLLPCSFPSLPPSPNLSHLISLPPRLELTLALICSSDLPPPLQKNYFPRLFVIFSLCSGLLPVSISPLISCCLALRPPPVISLHLSVAPFYNFLENTTFLSPRHFLFSVVSLSSQAAKRFGARSGLWEDPGGWLLYEATSLNK